MMWAVSFCARKRPPGGPTGGNVLRPGHVVVRRLAVDVHRALTGTSPVDAQDHETVAWQALLLSKDRRLLSIAKGLSGHDIRAQTAI